MRVITESEGVSVHHRDDNWHVISVRHESGCLISPIDPRIPTEALLAIVADRLKEAEPGTLEGIAWGLVIVAVHTLDCQGVAPWLLGRRLAARSPDTKQEEGR